MYNTADVSEIGCINLLGAILNQAIEDASRDVTEIKGRYRKAELAYIKRDAYAFITNARRVQMFLIRYGMGHVPATHIVNKAILVIKEGGTRARGNGREGESNRELDTSHIPLGF